MAKWAVEQSIFDSGKIRVKVRTAAEGEVSKFESLARQDYYVDIFDSKDEALSFASEAKNA